MNTSCFLMLAMLAGACSADKFADFKAAYGRKYATAAEEARRRAIFEANMVEAAKQQAVNPQATFGPNDFADRTAPEMAVYRGFKLEEAEVADKVAKVTGTAKPAVDWRKHGAVVGVKNQGHCGSCWAFSTTGGIEGQWALAGNKLTSLSEQELVDCVPGSTCPGGGLMGTGLGWLLSSQQGKIDTEASYPYTSGNTQVKGECKLSGRKVGATIESWAMVEKSDMTAWVSANGPLSLGVYAMTWMHYNGGIMTNCPNDRMDHGVLIVGYDNSAATPYWIIKNSWGASWGEEGYIRISKATEQCSIGGYQCSSKVQKAE